MFKNTEFIDKIKSEMKTFDDMVMLVAYGDFDYRPDLFSNIFIILYSEENDHRKKIENFKKITNDLFDLKYEILEEKQITFYTKNKLKINFKIKKPFSIENDKEIMKKRGINWDNSVLVRRNYTKTEITKNDINKFIKNLDDFYTHYYLGDFIKAYKNFNELLYILFDFYNIYDSSEQSKIWYTSNREEKKDLDKLVKASSELNPNTMIKKVKSIVNLFKENISNEYYDRDKIINVLDSIEKKYPHFFNLRDISRIPNIDSEKVILNEGLVYRSASLERYDEKEIEQFMKEHAITKIVDLRGKDEIALYKEKRNTFYSEDFKQKYIINIPIHLTEVKNLFAGDEQLNYYYHFLKTKNEQLKEIFENHFNDVNKNKMIIHCEGGKDRTGIIISLLLDFLDVEKRVIKKDFMMSYFDTSENLMDLIIDTLNQKYGGSESYLRDYCGVSQKTLDSIKQKFRLVQKAY